MSQLSSSEPVSVSNEGPPSGILLEFRPSYLFPTSHTFRTIYPHGGVDWQVTALVPLYYGKNSWLRGLDIWTAIDYFQKRGHSTDLQEKSKIQMVPLTLGLKFFFPTQRERIPIHFYMAAGMKYYFVHTHNDSPYVTSSVNVNGLGGVVEIGLLSIFIKHLTVDFFTAYSFRSFGAPTLTNPAVEAVGLNVSSLNVGGGVGFKF